MDRRERESLDRWLTTEPEWRTVNNEELHDWGMAFITKVDQTIETMPDSQEVKAQWMEGDWGDDLVTLCKSIEPEITEEQLEWVEQFLSEI